MENQIGTIISETRQNRKMTQEEFASRLGVTPQAVSKWERGLGLPDISLVAGICKILNLNANELLGVSVETKITENGDYEVQREIRNNMIAEPLLLEIGTGLIPVVAEGLKTDAIAAARKKLAAETGFLMPLVRIRDNIEMTGNQVRISIYGNVVCEEEMQTYHTMVTKLSNICRKHYSEILNKQLVKTMIDNVKDLYPGVADDLVPEKISYLAVEQELKRLVREQGNIRDMIHILENLESALKNDAQ